MSVFNAHDYAVMHEDRYKKHCYQCDKLVSWLAPDARCSRCTRVTPEEVLGESDES